MHVLTINSRPTENNSSDVNIMSTAVDSENQIYTVAGKKETKMFFCNIFYKTLAILMKFGTYM